MYKIGEKVYADAGEILVGASKMGYVFNGELEEFSAENILIDDMRIEGSFLIYSNEKIMELYDTNVTYEQLKTKYVKRLFSNDDQIAIILNKGCSEEDDFLYNKMQEYRQWCSILAKKVISLKRL